VFCSLTSVIRQKLSIGQQQVYFSAVGFGDDVRPPQCSFALGGFFCQDMAGTGFTVKNFSAAGFFKPFGRRSIGFNFWHNFFSSILNIALIM